MMLFKHDPRTLLVYFHFYFSFYKVKRNVLKEKEIKKRIVNQKKKRKPKKIIRKSFETLSIFFYYFQMESLIIEKKRDVKYIIYNTFNPKHPTNTRA